MDTKKRKDKVGFSVLWVWCTVVFILLGCQGRVPEEEIVARVGNAVLSREEMNEGMVWRGMRPEEESEFVERWIDRELLYQEAKRLGLDKTKELEWQLELVKREYLINKLLERTFAKEIQITEEEITVYYEKNKEQFRVDEDEVHALHILVNRQSEARAALQEIRAGRPFKEVAMDRSVGMFQENGGDMGFFKREDVIPEVSRVAFHLAEGRVSSSFRSSHGYHILKVLKRRSKGDVKDLSEVRDEILQRLRVGKERSVYHDLLIRLQNQTKVYVPVPPVREERGDTLGVR